MNDFKTKQKHNRKYHSNPSSGSQILIILEAFNKIMLISLMLFQATVLIPHIIIIKVEHVKSQRLKSKMRTMRIQEIAATSAQGRDQ